MDPVEIYLIIIVVGALLSGLGVRKKLTDVKRESAEAIIAYSDAIRDDKVTWREAREIDEELSDVSDAARELVEED